MNSAQRIWDKLISAGLTPAGAAGLMGNLYAESGLIPTNLQNNFEKKLGFTDADYTAAVDCGAYDGFVSDGAGYGLAQWTYPSRKAALLAYAKARGQVCSGGCGTSSAPPPASGMRRTVCCSSSSGPPTRGRRSASDGHSWGRDFMICTEEESTWHIS